jgi:hypothetical protein
VVSGGHSGCFPIPGCVGAAVADCCRLRLRWCRRFLLLFPNSGCLFPDPDGNPIQATTTPRRFPNHATKDKIGFGKQTAHILQNIVKFGEQPGLGKKRYVQRFRQSRYVLRFSAIHATKDRFTQSHKIHDPFSKSFSFHKFTPRCPQIVPNSAQDAAKSQRFTTQFTKFCDSRRSSTSLKSRNF